jgi:hypothetical protein
VQKEPTKRSEAGLDEQRRPNGLLTADAVDALLTGIAGQDWLRNIFPGAR